MFEGLRKPEELIVIVVTLLMLALLFLFFRFTSTGLAMRAAAQNPISARLCGIPVGRMDYLQGDNEMRTFASMTGGRAYFPRFEGELPELFGDISQDIHNQYTLSYAPTNTKLDGTYRKLKVQVVAPDGGPIKVRDQKGKDVKIEVVSRDGYTAKHTVD